MSTWKSDQDSFNKGGMVAFVFSMVFTIGFFIYITFIHKGIDLQEVTPDVPPAQTSPAGGEVKPAAPEGGAAPEAKPEEAKPGAQLEPVQDMQQNGEVLSLYNKTEIAGRLI